MDFMNFLFPEKNASTPTTNINFNGFFSIAPSASPTSTEDNKITNMIDNSTNISYNFYPIFSSKIQPSYTGYIQYGLPGKENDPNIVIAKPHTSTSYVSKNLFIFSKIHDFPDIDSFDGELVIENAPISNGDKPFYMCFPLKTDASSSKNILYEILEGDRDTKNLDINLNTILPLEGFSFFYETPYSIIAVSQTPITVPASFVGLNRGKIDDLWTPPQNVSVVRTSCNALYMKKMGDFSSPVSFGSPIQKHIIEGFDCSGNSCDYLECDSSNIELQDDIPTYMIPAGSNHIDLKEKTLNMTITIVWLLFIIVIALFMTPVLFGILARLALKGNGYSESLKIVNRVEAFISLMVIIPAIVLISVGAPKSLQCPDDDKDCVKEANKLIIPGTILLGIWVFFVLSMAWTKYTNPNFLGFKDIAKIDPYHTYQSNQIGFTQLFNPLGFMTIVSVFMGAGKP
jgi:hypothetical protein